MKLVLIEVTDGRILPELFTVADKRIHVCKCNVHFFLKKFKSKSTLQLVYLRTGLNYQL